MADKTAIEWTDATAIVDRGGRRVRLYRRQNPSRPGQQRRRLMAALGFAWCRMCEYWLSKTDMRSGLCREHRAAEYRANYARNPGPIRQRVYARKRRIDPVPMVGADHLLDWFERICAYCDAPATTWDHIEPVSKGGLTVPGNIVPACISCNSSKGTADVIEWLERVGRPVKPILIDVMSLLEAA